MNALLKSKFPPLYTLPILSLIFIAIFQLVMSNFDVLSPWKGGGFGMFSSLKNPGMRRVTVKVNFADGQSKWVSSKQFSKMASYDQLRAFPKEAKLKDFIEELQLLKWKHRHGDAETFVRINSTGENAKSIEVGVAELVYEKGTVTSKELLTYKWVKP
ncbi:hypothetical protein PQO01_01600 [Lentisphaera marina]|uniref:hypothetical protein n=1 Tax=Lentisphaera marina TaxID=1111041 RepID=UPI0023672B58|nr:hypothetical protein [Lentisphaera marina]MDD7983642.1 hypothetical protein [Lentisphaera marina]